MSVGGMGAVASIKYLTGQNAHYPWLFAPVIANMFDRRVPAAMSHPCNGKRRLANLTSSRQICAQCCSMTRLPRIQPRAANYPPASEDR